MFISLLPSATKLPDNNLPGREGAGAPARNLWKKINQSLVVRAQLFQTGSRSPIALLPQCVRSLLKTVADIVNEQLAAWHTLPRAFVRVSCPCHASFLFTPSSLVSVLSSQAKPNVCTNTRDAIPLPFPKFTSAGIPFFSCGSFSPDP